MIKAVLFDLDGTFADTAPDLAAAVNHVRQVHHLPPLPLEILRPQASHGSVGLLKAGMNAAPTDANFPAFRDLFLDHYTAHICDQTSLFPGMAEFISALEEQGLPWGIVTNKPHRFTLPLMQALGYAERAACLVSGDTCENSKPHPQPMWHAAKILQIAAENCLYLGDDKRDMEAANAAGMTGIIAEYGYIDPTANLDLWQAAGRVKTLAQLSNYLN